MSIKHFLMSFVTGGSITALIVILEESGHRTLSGVAALVPVFTLISYIFIGQSEGGLAVSQHSKFVLIGTLVTWVPYMALVTWLAPQLGPNKAIAVGLGAFLVLALGFVGCAERYRWF